MWMPLVGAQRVAQIVAHGRERLRLVAQRPRQVRDA